MSAPYPSSEYRRYPRPLIAAAYADGYCQAQGGSPMTYRRLLTATELAAWDEGRRDGKNEPPTRLSAASGSLTEDHGAELMRVAKMAAGKFVAGHPAARGSFDDLVGDAALAAVRAAGRHDGSQENSASLTTYTFRRAAGAIVDGIRERSLVSRSELKRGVRLADLPAHRQVRGSWEELAEETHLHPVDPLDGPDRLIERAEEMRQLGAAIDALPGRLRDVIARNFLNGETLTVIAEDLGVTLSQVSQDRKRALKLLRTALGNAWHDLPVQIDGGVRAQNEQLDYLSKLTKAGIVADLPHSAAASRA